MPDINDVHYNRDECIAAVRSYYAFLITMYLDASSVIEPPPEGWNFTPEGCRSLGKTDEVIELLRRLPYIRNEYGRHEEAPHVAPFVVMQNWSETLAGRCIDHNMMEEDREGILVITEKCWLMGKLPKSVVGITGGPRESPVWLIDTATGVAYWEHCPRRISRFGEQPGPWREEVWGEVESSEEEDENDEDDEDDDEQSMVDDEWKSDCSSWTVTDFFEVLKHGFRTLGAVPLGPRMVTSADWEGEAEVTALAARVFREHGWPEGGATTYRKEECIPAVVKAVAERFPEHSSVFYHSL